MYVMNNEPEARKVLLERYDSLFSRCSTFILVFLVCGTNTVAPKRKSIHFFDLGSVTLLGSLEWLCVIVTHVNSYHRIIFLNVEPVNCNFSESFNFCVVLFQLLFNQRIFRFLVVTHNCTTMYAIESHSLYISTVHSLTSCQLK